MRGLWVLAVLAMVAVPAVPAHPQSSSDLASVIVPLTQTAQKADVLPDAEAALLGLLNQVRRQQQLPPLMMDASLRRVARLHSQDMALRGFVGHGSPAGTSFAERLAGVVTAGSLVGENVTSARNIEQAHSAFVASTPHLRNILERRFRRVGIGVAGTGDLGLFITQDFAD